METQTVNQNAPISSNPQDLIASAGRGSLLKQTCEHCERRKTKCDGSLPCENCVKWGEPNLCNYVERKKPGRKRRIASDQMNTQTTGATRKKAASGSGSETVPWTKADDIVAPSRSSREADRTATIPSVSMLGTCANHTTHLDNILEGAQQLASINPGFRFRTSAAAVFWEAGLNLDIDSVLSEDRDTDSHGVMWLLSHLFLFSAASMRCGNAEHAELFGSKAVTLLKKVFHVRRQVSGDVVEQLVMAALVCILNRQYEAASAAINGECERLVEFIEYLLTWEGAGNAATLRRLLTLQRLFVAKSCIHAVWDGWYVTVSGWISTAPPDNGAIRDLVIGAAALTLNIFEHVSSTNLRIPGEQQEKYLLASNIWSDEPGTPSQHSWEHNALTRCLILFNAIGDSIDENRASLDQTDDKLQVCSTCIEATKSFLNYRLGDVEAAVRLAISAADMLELRQFSTPARYMYLYTLTVLLRTKLDRFWPLYHHVSGSLSPRDAALVERLLRDTGVSPEPAASFPSSTQVLSIPIAESTEAPQSLDAVHDDTSAYVALFGDIIDLPAWIDFE